MTLNSTKYFLIDANAIIDYYTGSNRDTWRIFKNIEEKRRIYSDHCIIVFIPNFCIFEVYKNLASMCYGRKKIEEETYKKVRQDFSNDISRTDQWSGIDDIKVKEKVSKKYKQKYFHLELSRYHILNGHYIYPFVHLAEDKEHHLSSLDVLIIAQGIELTKMYGKDNFAILTSDKGICKLGEILQDLSEDDLKNHNLLEYYRNYYPRIINARKYREYEDFIK